MIGIMTSGAHCHTSIHIQSYKHTHTIMQWCCTRVYETFLWKAVPIPRLCARIGAVQRIDCRISGLCTCHPRKFTRVMVESLVSAPATRAVYQIVGHIFCPAPWQLAKLIFNMLVSAPAAGAVQQIDCRIPGLCACHLCSLPEWWLDPWSLPLPPAVRQIVCQVFCLCACDLAVAQADFQNVGVCTCRRWSSGDWLSDPWTLHLPPAQFTELMVRSLVSALRLPPCSLPGWFSKSGYPHLPPVEFSRLIVGSLLCLPPVQFTRVMVGSSCILVLCACHPCNWPHWFSNCWSLRPPSVQFIMLFLKMLVCAPATGAVQQIDCRIAGLCACHLCSLPEWWLDPWSLHLPPMQYQIASQVLRLLPLHWVHATFVVVFL